jgi:hypothetical protein
MPSGRSLAHLLCLSLFCFVAGCPSPPDESTPEDEGTTMQTDSGTTGETTGAVAEEPPAVLLEPFDPPTLAELDAQVEWEEQPVLDAFEMMREHKVNTPPLVGVE